MDTKMIGSFLKELRKENLFKKGLSNKKGSNAA